MMPDVLVLGGGLTGLVAAARLRERGVRNVVVLEATERPGGLLKTNRDGVCLDYLPHVFFSTDPTARQVFIEAVGPVVSHHHRLGVLWRGGVVDYPFQDHVDQLPIADRRAVLLGLLKDRGRPLPRGTNLAAVATRHLGRGLVDLFFRPYNEKLWQSPIEAMEGGWLASKIRMPDNEELADSIIGIPPDRPRKVAPHEEFCYPASGGIESAVEGLLRRLGPEPVRTNEPVVRIDPKRRRVETPCGSHAYGAVISTLPLGRTLSLAGIPAGRIASRLRWTRVVCMQLVLDRVELPDRHWLYVPDPAVSFYRLTRTEQIHPDSAGGRCGLLVECAFPGGDRTAEDVVAARAMRDLVSLGIIRPEWVRRTWTFASEPAYAVPHRTRARDVPALLARLASAGIRSAGRFGEWAFYNMDHSIRSGIRVADEVIA